MRWLPFLRRVMHRAAAVGILLGFRVVPLPAQNFSAINLHEPTPLGGVWLIQAGDAPAYAQSNWDDSGWTRFDAGTSLNRVFPKAKPSVVWYRLHVKTSPSHTGLALLERNISSAFEVYVNGRRLLHCGTVAPFVPCSYGSMLLAAIPDAETATGTLVIAMRVHISPNEWGGVNPGYEASNLTLGQESALRDRRWLTALGQNAVTWVVLLAGISLGIVALALYWAQPHHREYLWLFLQFAFPLPALPLSAYSSFHAMPAAWGVVSPALTFCSDFFAILMYFAMLRLRMAKWMRWFLVASAVGVVVFIDATAQQMFSLASTQIPLLPLTVFSFGVIPVLIIVEWRRGNREAPILLIPLLATGLTIYLELIMVALTQVSQTAAMGRHLLKLLYGLHVGPLQVLAFNVCSIIYVLSLAIIIVLRSTRASRRHAVMEAELAAAREVQRVLVPERALAVPGFKIESVFQPADQVGGDFFQILPDGEDGLLLVLGDVAGKGLPAAMLVSVLVGAIRGIAEYTRVPSEILSNLNDRLVGKAGGGFSTGLAARIGPDGWVVIANAGHLMPYLDGQEIELSGSLPLGVAPGTQYETARFVLPPGSRLTFVSDGVVEAQNQRRELFGFDRARELSVQPAESIAAAARQFGQCDDITVVTIEREAVALGVSRTLSSAEVLPG